MTEKELLLTAILKCQRADLYFSRPALTKEQEDRLAYCLSLRSQGIPLQYVLGETGFFGLRFKVDKRVLIPRPETELLVETVIRRVKPACRQGRDAGRGTQDEARILDIGTGSSCIAVALAKYLPNARVTAVDISCQALDLARENALLNEVSDRINFIQSDLFALRKVYGALKIAKRLSPKAIFLPPGESGFDIIVSNPPYICSKEIEKLSAEVSNEPRLALDGGNDGLDFYREIIPRAGGSLNNGGLLFLEIGWNQRKAIEGIIDKQNALKLEEVIKDYSGIERIIVLGKWIN